MNSYYDSFFASMKVAYDKTNDYLFGSKTSDNDVMPDSMTDYNDVINPELYNSESSLTSASTRLLPAVGYYEEYSVFFDDPTHIIDNIYLGSAYNAASTKTLRSFDIKFIINATKEISNYYPDEFTYVRYKLHDNNKNSIIEYLNDAYEKILEYQKLPGNIFIHCFMGASRSASIVIYYLMKRKNMEFNTALEFIRNKRSIINPTFRLTKDLAKKITTEK